MSEDVSVWGEDLPDFSEIAASEAVVARIGPCELGSETQEYEGLAVQPTDPCTQCLLQKNPSMTGPILQCAWKAKLCRALQPPRTQRRDRYAFS